MHTLDIADTGEFSLSTSPRYRDRDWETFHLSFPKQNPIVRGDSVTIPGS